MTHSQLSGACLHIVYSSRLAPSADYTAYIDICRASRRRHSMNGISSVLLFDGQRFCQWLQGEPGATNSLMKQVAQDKRHAAIKTQVQVLLPQSEFALGWLAGFVESDAMDNFHLHHGTAPDQVLAAFGRLLATADVEPSAHIRSAGAHSKGPGLQRRGTTAFALPAAARTGTEAF